MRSHGGIDTRPWAPALLLIASFLAGCATTTSWRLAEGQNPQVFHAEVRKQIDLHFLLFLPRGYRSSHAPWPLLIFLHGSGERGSDLDQVKVHGPPKLVAMQKEFPFILVSPQVPAGMAWDSDALNTLLDQLLVQLNVDPDRVYLTGLSMGGYGTWNLATEHPERFAAIAPISGAGDSDHACALKDMPIWAFHGAIDPVVPVLGDQQMVDAVRACGGKVEFTVYPDVGHDAWTQTYANPELYQWLLRHRRSTARSP